MSSLHQPRLTRALRAAAIPAALGLVALWGGAVRGGDGPPPQGQQVPPKGGQPPPGGQQPPGGQPPQGGAGGDGGAKPKAASMVIEETAATAEPPPPAPQGEEKRMIGEYIASRVDDVRDCYARRLEDRKTLQGRLMVHFHIGPNGRVIGATADGIGDTLLIACVVAAVRKWEFEPPQAGGKLRVDYPFKLMPEAQR